ncbi:MAG: cytoplasmic protein [Thermodesulfobacteriota bacterium]|nr:cytoplasmic protein [Thermodesulfobacteriota bacterium]
MANEQIDFVIDKNNLYRDESITDLKVGAIRCLIPIKTDGTDDESRERLFVGHTQLMSPQGAVPVQASIQAATLEEAMEKFPGAMRQAMEEMIEQAKKMHAEQGRQQQGDSRIIMPGR